MNEWHEVSLGDIANIGTGKTNSQDETEKGAYPLFDRSAVIKRSNKYLFDCKAVIVPGEGREFLPRYFSGKFDLHQRAYYITSKSEDNAQTKFLYYYLNQYRSYWERVAVGSTVRSLRLSSFTNFPVRLPPIKTQKRITNVLSSLDDKIQLNQEMNKTLEEMAMTIFKDWFVDFGPTRRKMEGATDPSVILGGLFSDAEKTAATARLFPAKFISSEIGKVPDGWKINTLGQHVSLTKGRSYKKMELQDSEVALVTLKSFLRGGGYRYDGLKPYIGKHKEEQIVEEGDLIIALTDVTQDADVIGKPALARNSTKYKTLVASLDVGIIRLTANSNLTKNFCYYLMRSDRYTSHSLTYTSGTTVLHLAKEAPLSYKFAEPPKELIKKIDSIVAPMHSRIFQSEKENEILSKLRDLFLSNLMTGKIYLNSGEFKS